MDKAQQKDKHIDAAFKACMGHYLATGEVDGRVAVRAWLASVGLTSAALTTWDGVFRAAGYGNQHRPSELTGWAEATRAVEQA